MVTRLFLHAASSAVSGTLPSSEQSTLTSANDFEANQATNRSMSQFRGTGQTSLANTSTASASQVIYYGARWVSDVLTQTSIAANTWTINFAASHSNVNANFPSRTSANQDFHVNIYVWKPSNGTKYGTIVDGVTSQLTHVATSERCFVATVSGSAVSSLTSGDAVIVVEFWFKITQALATAYTQTLYFDGKYINVDNATSSNNASHISTPENLSFSDSYVTTKLYLHNTTSGLPSGTLPSAEQSSANTVTANCNFEGSQTTNRLMNSTIGVSQASLSLATPANTSANTFYVSRWVSPVINQTSVPAGPWVLNFAAAESNTSANFPCSGNLQSIEGGNIYVWKPSNGTLYGRIYDNLGSDATINEGTAAQEKSQETELEGSAVSSLTSGDAVIVFEMWFPVTQGSATSYTDTFYYDGTTETVGGSTVSNHATFIEYQGGGGLLFGGAPTNYDRPLSAETITISEVSLTRLYGANRAPTAETISIGESQARVFTGTRALSAETNTIGESQTRIYGANRAPTAETNTIGESLARLFGANRSLSDTTAISEAIAKVQVLVRSLSDTTAISESLARIFGVIKNLSDTTVISESIARLFTGTRALTAETTTIGESLARLKAANRSLSDTVTIGESLARILGVIRSLSDTTVISESLARIYTANRSLSDTIAISESLAKVQTLVRNLSDTNAISESLSRILGISRSLSDTTTIGESLSRVLGAIRALATQITTIGESLSRVFGAVRTLSDTTVISESLARLIAVIRSLSDTTVITGIVDSLYTPVGGGAVNYNRSLSDTTAISESLARSISNIRSLIETTIIGESLTRILGAIRSLTDTTIISESLARLAALTRSLSDTSAISESLTKIYGAVRNISDTTIISELLSRLLGLTRTLTETTIISETLSRFQGLTRALTDTTIISESLTRVYGILKSLSDTISISDLISRSVVIVRNLIESVTILESLIRTIIGIIVDYVPSLETDFTNYVDEMIISYIFTKWNATGQLLKGSDMIDANSPVEFKIGIHSSRPYQVLALEQQTEIDKLSINKFGGGISRFFTTVEVTVMVQRLQRDIPIELSQMEKEIQRIVCHYTRNEIMGIDDLILVGMRREFTNRNNNDWSKSIWSTKIYFKAEYLKVNTEIMNINGY